MIGLKRGTVELQTYCDDYVIEAEKTIKLLQLILGNSAIRIEHIGSTAIKGVKAKPIIDIMVGVTDLEDVKSLLPKLKKRDLFIEKSHQEKEKCFLSVEMMI